MRKDYLDALSTDYTMDGLEKGIEMAKRNKEVFLEACRTEQKTIDEFEYMISVKKGKDVLKK